MFSGLSFALPIQLWAKYYTFSCSNMAFQITQKFHWKQYSFCVTSSSSSSWSSSSSSSSLPGLLYIPLFKGPEVRSRNNSGTALQMPPNGLYISSTTNYNDISSTTNYNDISSTTNYNYISSTNNYYDPLHFRKVAKRWKEVNLNNYFTQKVQKRRRSKYPLH